MHVLNKLREYESKSGPSTTYLSKIYFLSTVVVNTLLLIREAALCEDVIIIV